jgi:hypothetical protein
MIIFSVTFQIVGRDLSVVFCKLLKCAPPQKEGIDYCEQSVSYVGQAGVQKNNNICPICYGWGVSYVDVKISPYAVSMLGCTMCVIFLTFSVFFVHYIISLMRLTNRLGRGSSVGIATRWTVRGSNPSGARDFACRPDRPWGQPNLQYKDMGQFPGVKRPGCGVNHLPHLALRLEKE